MVVSAHGGNWGRKRLVSYGIPQSGRGTCTVFLRMGSSRDPYPSASGVSPVFLVQNNRTDPTLPSAHPLACLNSIAPSLLFGLGIAPKHLPRAAAEDVRWAAVLVFAALFWQHCGQFVFWGFKGKIGQPCFSRLLASFYFSRFNSGLGVCPFTGHKWWEQQHQRSSAAGRNRVRLQLYEAGISCTQMGHDGDFPGVKYSWKGLGTKGKNQYLVPSFSRLRHHPHWGLLASSAQSQSFTPTQLVKDFAITLQRGHRQRSSEVWDNGDLRNQSLIADGFLFSSSLFLPRIICGHP